MSEQRSRSDRPGGGDARRGPETIGHDLEALRSLSDQGPPELETCLGAARRRAPGVKREGFAMVIQFMRTRPALATVLGVIVVAAGLLVFPISYQRTVGYDVALTLAGGNIAEPQVREIARGFKETLGAAGAKVTASMENGRLTYVLQASSSRDVRGSAEAFARGLENLGYTANVTATPRRETVSTNVYAYAMSRVIEISTDGKSSAQLESEIRQRLQAAGVTQADVSVTDVGEHGRAVRINAQQTSENGVAHEEMPELVLTRDGKPLGGDRVEVRRKKDASGATSLVVAVTVEGKATSVEIPNAGSMSDAALGAEIQSRLLAAGLDAVVTVHGDEISVEKRQP
jgi:hypothetical protein